jgi:hypothetical protein
MIELCVDICWVNIGLKYLKERSAEEVSSEGSKR